MRIKTKATIVMSIGEFLTKLGIGFKSGLDDITLIKKYADNKEDEIIMSFSPKEEEEF